MKHFLFHNPVSKRLQRSQRGQSILLMAFAFIALVAFVGLVTDIALLFVRYASLRRAVDAAAIAAAGQIREGTDYGEVTIAAQQYIELHNLEPDSVLVETCETDIYDWRRGAGEFAQTSPPDPNKGPHPESLYPPPVANHMPETELCDWDDPRKLVRVSAQIESPTTFLSLIGIESLTLEATSVSETAVLDIALVLDTSESMAQDTTTGSYTNIGLTFPAQAGVLNSVRAECETPVGETALSRERYAECCNDPGQGHVGDGRVQNNGVFLPNGLIWHDTNSNNMYDGSFENGVANHNPNDNYTTLICNPFKDVRDAARLFIKRLDFVRGDRVVLVTFDRQGIPYDPDDTGTTDGPLRPLMRSEQVAIDTLNTKIGVLETGTGVYNRCQLAVIAYSDWMTWVAAMNDPAIDPKPPQPDLRPHAYETLASCGQTNIGGGILAANNALTDPVDVRREAVWVMIVLSDGAANTTNKVGGITSETEYGYWGYCPWWTFCCLSGSTQSGCNENIVWPECSNNNPTQQEYKNPICNDNEPNTRHFCLDWDTGLPIEGDADCGSTGHYDADDYARDMADFAGLIEVSDSGAPGNFIALFAIGFGREVADEPTAAPLLRYIADAGDNGFIDNNLQQDWRDNQQLDYPVGGPYPPGFGDPGPCEGVTNPRTQCGQYYFASDLSSLTQVFEEIAGRLFTRLSR
jgi:hypothetical protein